MSGWRQMSRRTTTLIVGSVLLLVLAALVAEVRVPYVAEGPGPTVNTLGSYQGKKVITVTGRDVPTPSGHLNLTTVSVTENFNLLTAMRYWASSKYTVVPREIIYPPSHTEQQTNQQNVAQFAQSQSSAETVALREAGFPVYVVVDSLSSGSPSAGLLKADDRITAVDGTTVTSVQKLQDLVNEHKPGEIVAVTARRDKQSRQVRVRLGKNPDDASRPLLGISLKQQQPHPGITITFAIDKIGGPSAGLMFTLGLVDMLEPGNLTGGRFIAGTGEIDDEGEVLPIGGIHQKTVAARAAGATYFLTPSDNCGEAEHDLPGGLRLVKVTDVGDALAALKTIRTGQGSLPACPS